MVAGDTTTEIEGFADSRSRTLVPWDLSTSKCIFLQARYWLILLVLGLGDSNCSSSTRVGMTIR